jgi:hypothetical protein
VAIEVPNLNGSDGSVDLNGLTTFLTALDGVVSVKRVSPITPSATPTIDVGTTAVAKILGMTVAITGLNMTGDPTSEQPLMIVFESASVLAIAHGPSFIAGPGALLTTTAAGKTHRAFYVWDSVATKWVCMASHSAGY